MAEFCIKKEKMKEILEGIKSLEGDIETLAKMLPEEKTMFFKKYLGDDAQNMTNSMERALLSKRKRALGDWIKKNFDETTRTKDLSNKQKAVLNKYILDKTLPIKSNVVLDAGEKIASLPKDKRDEYLKKFFKKEQIDELNRKLDKALDISRKQKLSQKSLLEAKRIEKNLYNFIERYTKGKIASKKKTGITTKDIINLPKDKRDEYLKSLGVKEVAKISKEIDEALGKKAYFDIKNKENAVENRKVLSQKRIIDNFIQRNLFIVEKSKRGTTYKMKVNKTIDEIIEMSDEERLSFFSKNLKMKNPEEVNRQIKNASKSAFEKNIEKDLRKVTNLSEMEYVINNKLNTVINEKNKVPITVQQVEKINKLSRDIEDARIKMNKTGKLSDRIDYSERVIDLKEYASELMPPPTKTDIAFSTLSSLQRALLASFEMSATAIQGYPHLARYVNIFNLPDARFMWHTLGRAIEDGIFPSKAKRHLAEIMSYDSADAMIKGDVALSLGAGKMSHMEEDFASVLFKNYEKSDNVFKKIFGTFWKAPQIAYSSYLTSIRAQHFDSIYQGLKQNGYKFDNDNIKEIGRIVNDFTGASRLGKLETGHSVQALNSIFFSVRKLVSDVRKFSVRIPKDIYVAGISKNATPADKYIAKRGLTKTASMVGTYLAIFGLIKLGENAGMDVSMETDPRSTKFGEARIGKETINVSGGADWFPTLMSRILSNGEINSLGVYVPYGTGMYEKSKLEAVSQTIRYKFSPNLALITDSLAGQNAVGEKFFAGATREDIKKAFEGDEGAIALLKEGAQREAFTRLVPIYWQSVIENPTALQGLGFFGFAVNNAYYGTNFEDTDSVKIQQFGEEKGKIILLEAEEKYNDMVLQKVSEVRNTQEFIDLSSKEQIEEMRKVKREALKEIFFEYNFTYETEEDE